MRKKNNTLSLDECNRLDEILFYNLIHNLFIRGRNPIHVYSFVEAVCNIASCSITIINSVVTIILTEDNRYAPDRVECILLFSKACVPIRTICSDFNLSNTTYYDLIHTAKHNAPITPKFDNKQDIEINKFIDALETITEITRRI